MLIGELAARLGINTKTIRFYESIGLLPDPQRTASGYRSYDDGVDVQRLTFIKSAQRLGLRLDEIKEIIAFRDRGEQPCSYVADVLERHVTDLDGRIREMRALREQLSELHARAAVGAQSDSSYCAVIEQPPRLEG